MDYLVLDTIVYGFQVIIFQIIASPTASLFSYKIALSKNKNWVRNNQDFLKKYTEPMIIHHYVLGVLFLIAIGYSFLIASTQIMYWVHWLSIFVILAQQLGYDMVRFKQIRSQIPASEVRKASITPRRWNQYLPSWLIILGSIFFVISILGCLYLFSNPKGVEGLSKMAIWSIIVQFLCFSVLVHTLKRKPVTPHLDLALFYRKSEIWMTSLILFCFILLSLLIFIGHYFGIDFLIQSKKIIRYICTLIPMVIFVWFVTSPSMKKISREKFQ